MYAPEAVLLVSPAMDQCGHQWARQKMLLFMQHGTRPEALPDTAYPRSTSVVHPKTRTTILHSFGDLSMLEHNRHDT